MNISEELADSIDSILRKADGPMAVPEILEDVIDETVTEQDVQQAVAELVKELAVVGVTSGAGPTAYRLTTAEERSRGTQSRKPIRHMVADYVREHGPCSAKAVAEGLGLSARQAGNALQQLRISGHAESMDDRATPGQRLWVVLAERQAPRKPEAPPPEPPVAAAPAAAPKTQEPDPGLRWAIWSDGHIEVDTGYGVFGLSPTEIRKIIHAYERLQDVA